MFCIWFTVLLDFIKWYKAISRHVMVTVGVPVVVCRHVYVYCARVGASALQAEVV